MLLALALLAAPDAALSEAYWLASEGLRQPGDTVPLTGTTDRQGRAIPWQSLDHIVRLVVVVEPLTMDEGLKRFAWWSSNASKFNGLASVLAMPCGSALPQVETPGLTVIDDAKCRQAALFGAIRPYGKRLGGLPAVFVLDEGGIIRATIEPAPVNEQQPKIVAAIRRLRRQLARQSQRY